MFIFLFLIRRPLVLRFEITSFFANWEDVLFAFCKTTLYDVQELPQHSQVTVVYWYVAPLLTKRLRVRVLSGSISFFVLFVV